MVAGPADLGGDFSSGKIPSIKLPLTLQSTQGSDLNLGWGSASSNVPEEGTENVPEQRNDTSSPVPEYGPLWEVAVYKFKNDIVAVFEQYVRILKKLNNVPYTFEIQKNNTDPTITEVAIAQ